MNNELHGKQGTVPIRLCKILGDLGCVNGCGVVIPLPNQSNFWDLNAYDERQASLFYFEHFFSVSHYYF